MLHSRQFSAKSLHSRRSQTGQVSAILTYRLYGLVVQSEIPFPGLAPTSRDGPPDVVVHAGVIDAAYPRDPGVHHVPGGALLCVPDTGQFLCLEGSRVIVDALPGVPIRNLALYLLGSAMGLVLHQLGYLPLHACTIEFNGEALAFAGPSGAGKSTLADWFQERGHAVIADDVSVLTSLSDGTIVVQPGLPRLRLWREVLNRTGRSHHDYVRSFIGDDEWDKFDVPIRNGGVQPVALKGVVLVARGEDSQVSRLVGVGAAETLIANIYRGECVSPGQLQGHLRSCIQIARHIPVWCWTRQWGHDCYDSEVLAMLSHLGEGDQRRPCFS